MNSGQGIVAMIFVTLAILLFISAVKQSAGSPAKKARLRAAVIFAAVGIALAVWHLAG